MPDVRPIAPFHGPATPPAGPRLLLLSYYFAPSRAVGGLRWQRFSHFLAAAGVGLDVITLDPASLAAADSGRLADLPAGMRLFGVPEPVLTANRVENWMASAKRVLRPGKPRGTAPAAGAAPTAVIAEHSEHRDDILAAAGLIPPIRRTWNVLKYYARFDTWASDAETTARAILGPEHRGILSSGPPHSAHEAARRLSRISRLPFIVDMRDPWSQVERVPSFVACPAWYRIAEKKERRVLAEASRLFMASPRAANVMIREYPAYADKISAILNGCDETIMPAASQSRFLVAYAGSVYLDRDPRPTFRAAAQVIRELRLSPAQFGIEFMGRVQGYQGQSLEKLAAEEGVGDYVKLWPIRPREEALAFLAGAAVLLSLPQDSDLAIPAKLYEYMQYDAWILAMTEPESATSDLLRATGADTVSARDIDGIARILRERYLSFTRGERPRALAREERFTRGYQAGQLLQAIAPLIGLTSDAEAPCAR